MLPILWKAGVKTREQVQKFEDDQLAKRFDYAPEAAQRSRPAPGRPTPRRGRTTWGMNDGSITPISGGSVFMPNLRAIADLYSARPQDFRQNWGTNSDNFYESYVAAPAALQRAGRSPRS